MEVETLVSHGIIASFAALAIIAGAVTPVFVGAKDTLLADVVVAPLHVGDMLTYQRDFTYAGHDEDTLVHHDVVSLVGEPSRASDRFGIERDVDAFSVEVTDDGGTVEFSCVNHAGTAAFVRSDILAGARPYGGTGSSNRVTGEETVTKLTTMTRFEGDCVGRTGLEGRAFSRGDTLLLDEVRGTGLRFSGLENESRPSTVGEREGARALAFHFPAKGTPESDTSTDNGLVVTLVDGRAGIAALRVVDAGAVRYETGKTITDAPFEMTLVAHQRGAGAVLESRDASLLAAVDGLLADAAPLGLPLHGIDLAFSYPDAFNAAVADPQSCLGEFLDAHADAFLAYAEYDATVRDPLLPRAKTDGGWELAYFAGESACSIFMVRLSPVAPGAPAIIRVYPELDLEPGVAPALPPTPEQMMTSDAVARLVKSESFGPVLYVVFSWGDSPRLDLSELPLYGAPHAGEFDGRIVSIDPLVGGMTSIRFGEGKSTSPLPVGGQQSSRASGLESDEARLRL